MRIVVLGGGLSTERHVSLVTATSVCKALRSIGHQAIFIDTFFGLENYDGELEDAFLSEDGFCGDVQIERSAPDIASVIASRKDQSKSRLGKNVIDICRLADCVFLGLHGADGEDGKLQAVLDLYGIPFTGSDTLGSALSMNKKYTKEVMTFNDIPTPSYTDHAPCVVKQVDGGSSIGTWICDTDEEYRHAMEEVHGEFIVETKINGREFTVPILDDKPLSVIEICANNGRFDYVSKYQSGADGAKEICPAEISESESKLLQFLALKLHKALGLKVYSRIDFILDDQGNAWCLEVNTLPGMTPASLIPKAAKLEGLDYPQLCDKIISLSLNK